MTTASDWKGRTGQIWAESVGALDLMLDEVGQMAMGRMGSLERLSVLDLGCGAGQTTQQLTALGAVPTGIDISQDLLTVAKTRNHTAEFILGDAGGINLNGPYDHLFSRFGAMFFDDPIVAYSHIRSQVGPNCRFTIVCWAHRKKNKWATVPLQLGAGLIQKQGTHMQGQPGPFAWEDEDVFEPILSQSGWKNVQWKAVEIDLPISMGNGSDPIENAVKFVSRVGPLAQPRSDLSTQDKTKLDNRLREDFHKRVQGDVVKLGGLAWIIEGHS